MRPSRPLVRSTREGDQLNVTKEDLDWLELFIVCSVFGPPPSEVERARRILWAIKEQRDTEIHVAAEERHADH
jgi:hypothetical protein